MSILAKIASIPLFQGLPAEQLQELAMILTDQVCRRGQLIFSEGEEGNGFYVVVSGRVKIFKLSPDGKEQILHIFGAGEPIGEVAVFSGQRFPANAEAFEDSRLFFFPRSTLMELIKRNPSIALNMLAELSRRLRRFASLIEGLSLKEVPGRLAAYILHLSDSHQGADNLSLDISKGQLSSLLGTIPETLSRILTKMNNAGLIQTEGARYLRILDRSGLEELANGDTRLH
jgi:CRP/FNR family transcriptional regulator